MADQNSPNVDRRTMTTAQKIRFSAMTLVFVMGLAVHMGAATSAQAQQVCFPREDGLARLASQHDEQVSARGLATGGKQMFEITTGPKGGWTLLVTDVAGRSCVIAHGEAWTPVKTQSDGVGS